MPNYTCTYVHCIVDHCHCYTYCKCMGIITDPYCTCNTKSIAVYSTQDSQCVCQGAPPSPPTSPSGGRTPQPGAPLRPVNTLHAHMWLLMCRNTNYAVTPIILRPITPSYPGKCPSAEQVGRISSYERPWALVRATTVCTLTLVMLDETWRL